MPNRKHQHGNETHCLNCGTALTGPFCSQCGQKAHLHKDSFWHMAAHFIGDYFHYDSKFWTTIKSLFTQPGQATLEFIDGKRAKYLNPIQLYIFVVTIFILVTLRSEESTEPAAQPGSKTEQTDSLNSNTDEFELGEIDTSKPPPMHIGISTNKNKNVIGLGPWTPTEPNLQVYDSVQQSLPESARDGFLKSALRRKALTYNAYDPEVFQKMYWEAFRHNIPKVLFILLPFFAFLLKLFFWKSKRYYVDHIIFSLHYHSMLFLMIIIDFVAVAIWENETFDSVLAYLLLAGSATYLFLSLKRVYQSPAWLILIKQFFIFVLYLVTFTLSMLALLLVTFLIL